MAKNRPTVPTPPPAHVEDIQPVDGFVSPGAGEGNTADAEQRISDSGPTDSDRLQEMERVAAEQMAALRAENARLLALAEKLSMPHPAEVEVAKLRAANEAVKADAERTTSEAAAERKRLLAELEELKRKNVIASPSAGKYRVSLKDGPAAVVECQPGEHPFEAYKSLTGVTGSIHAPEIIRAKADATVGVVR